MKKILMTAAMAALLGGCATSAPPTSWGKANVSRTEYGTDIGMCTGTAAMVATGNGANNAGGLNGQNNQAPAPTHGDGAKAAGQGGGTDTTAVTTGTAFPTGGGGAYRDSVPQDMVARAASQQQALVLAEKRARADAFKSCITQRGYQEFLLTPEQQAHLKSLKTGSNEYHEYLYTLGADPSVLRSQVAAKQ